MIFERSESLLGTETMSRISNKRVLIVGVGGVGSWCAEALVRTGFMDLTIMDDDIVAPSNINRQCPALMSTVGQDKVEVMSVRLKEINPEAKITALKKRYLADGENVDLSQFDLIIDAIDSVDCKAALILDAFTQKVPIISSMGAARRLDPTKVRISQFCKVNGDGLAKALRARFKKLSRYPGKFECVWSEEPPMTNTDGSVPRGSVMQVTCAFAMALASRAID
jgi:tRNA A37 threonylcarbamoyladenosine dehydratase